MESINDVILSKEFGRFLPGFHGTQFLVFIGTSGILHLESLI
mgnify:CR=1 FL=1|jgi:hypothetical protein